MGEFGTVFLTIAAIVDSYSLDSRCISLSGQLPSHPLSRMNHTKIFIDRDYSRGVGVRFKTSPLPAELEGRISPEVFADAIEQLNVLFDEAENMNCGVCLENFAACLTAYMLFLCMKTRYERILSQVHAKVNQLNEDVFGPRDLMVVDPLERGLRTIEICIFHLRG